MKAIRLPDPIDSRILLLEEDAIHKEDWHRIAAVILPTSFTPILAMPNTQPPISDAASPVAEQGAACRIACCKNAFYRPVGADRSITTLARSSQAASPKMYFNHAHRSLCPGDMTAWLAHIFRWIFNVLISASKRAYTQGTRAMPHGSEAYGLDQGIALHPSVLTKNCFLVAANKVIWEYTHLRNLNLLNKGV